jgi:hypothetical protein
LFFFSRQLQQRTARAQAEELRRCRGCARYRTPRGARTGNGAPGGNGPRKRTAGPADDGAVTAMAGTRCETRPPEREPAKRSTVSSGGQRRRENGDAGAAVMPTRPGRRRAAIATATMARFIVAPYTPSLRARLRQRTIVQLNRPSTNLLQTATGGGPATGWWGAGGGNHGLSSLLQSLQQLQKQGNGAS